MKSKIKKVAVRGATSVKTRPDFNTSIVHVFKGELVTNSLAIAQEFGRNHKDVLRSLDTLIENGTISRRKSAPSDYIDARGKAQRVIELSERDFLIAMPFIGGKKSQQGQVRLVDAFLQMRADMGNLESWKETRQVATITYTTMSDTLLEVRAEEGKDTVGHHYCNEAKMINGVVFGIASAVDRDSLSVKQLDLLQRVTIKNTILIGKGKIFAERKAALIQYVAKLIGKAPPSLGGAS